MEMQIKKNTVPDIQIQVKGLEVLKENLGVVETLRFLEQFDNGGSGDYTKQKYTKDDEKYTKDELIDFFKLDS